MEKDLKVHLKICIDFILPFIVYYFFNLFPSYMYIYGSIAVRMNVTC